jgi:hypothetical protein
MFDLLLFALLCTGAYYLLARAEITRWLWQPLDGMRGIGPLLRCPACTGAWLGAGASFIVPVVGHTDHWWLACTASVVEHALLGMVCTAIGWGAMKWGLNVGAVSE